MALRDTLSHLAAHLPAATPRVRAALWPTLAPYWGPWRLVIVATFPDLRHRDGDNVQKQVWDGLQGVLYRNDAQVRRWGGGLEVGEPGLRVEATPLVPVDMWTPVVEPGKDRPPRGLGRQLVEAGGLL